MLSGIFSFFSFFNDINITRNFCLFVHAFSFTFKITLLVIAGSQLTKIKKIPYQWIYLFITLLCSTIEDFSWIISLSRVTFFTTIDYRIVLAIIRIAWACNIIMYQSLAFFIEGFIHKNNKISLHQKVFSVFSFIFAMVPLYLLVFEFNMIFNPPYSLTRSSMEFSILNAESFYALTILMPLTLIYVWARLREEKTPRILHAQLRSIAIFFVFPHLLANLMQMFPFSVYTNVLLANSLGAEAFSNIFLTLALYFCMRKITGMRFLNFHSHVHANRGFNFTEDFRYILESLGSATTESEVKYLTQRFFSKAFNIPITSTNLIIRIPATKYHLDHTRTRTLTPIEITVENFLEGNNHGHIKTCSQAVERLKNSQVFIYDEVDYDHFYDDDTVRPFILSFLEEIQADLFLPIYENNTIVGYITVERHARPQKLYSDVERDEMIIFTRYLSKIIYLLQNRNLTELLKQRKDVIEELYLKHQHINQYKESIRSFLKDSENSFGIMFYKNRRFVFANEESKNLIGINPNLQEGHALSRTLKDIARRTIVYKTSQTVMTKNPSGRKIILTSIPDVDYNNIIITVHYPEIYDTIKTQIDAIKDPSDWDYLLYLETTKSGKLINELIPGKGEIFLNFKIDLLKIALSKKAILLDLPDDDLEPTIELLHHISLRETLHSLTLQAHVTNGDTAIKLFGLNPLYGSSTEIPLLEKLNKKGTLFIKNIHFLDKESQEILAQFIKYGFYSIFKSDHRVQSDVRIICSTNQNLNALVQKGFFSQALFNELRKTSLSMPTLLTLPDKELNELIDGFTEQALSSNQTSNILTLSDKDRDKLSVQLPVSLHELKNNVQHILHIKAKKHNLHEDEFDPAYHVSDPKLVEAARLGKHALKDPKLLNMLWNKFNSQNKIALFLGVNRSSVHRRCKEYDII
ncbi:sigma 54-interacting transcriptional regulator [Candidatus Babeliales bacterium]|nr:sigma 54-interacting transcriptional regulator [Candidatus Babeliales bacterium]